MTQHRVNILLILSILTTAVLAACAGAGASAAPTEAPVLNIYNWSTYIAPELVPAFEKKYGVTVNYDEYGDNDELYAKIQAGNPGYDIIVPTDYMVQVMIKEDLLSPLDKSKISNFNNIDPTFLNAPSDPDNAHCVPYQWGTMGLGFNTEAAPGVDSWGVMFDGSHAGRISWLTESRMVLGVTLLYLGYDPNTTDPKQIDQAAQLLVDTKKDVLTFAPDTGQTLLDQGEVDITMEYSGDIFQIMSENTKVNYVIPKEGTMIWTDNLCIPKGAPHPDLAHKFIDFILDAQNGAALSNYTQYGTPNIASLDLITPELRNNPGIYPSEEIKKKLFFIRSLGDADKLYEAAWTKLGVSE
jgi:spermidine/putrescine transport system substrate-binding protein